MKNYRYVALAHQTDSHADLKDCHMDVGTWVKANSPREAIEVILKAQTDWYDFPGFEPSIELTRIQEEDYVTFHAEVDAHGLGYAGITVEDITDLIDHDAGIIRGAAFAKEEREAMN